MKKDKIVDKIKKSSEKKLVKCGYDMDEFCVEVKKVSAEVENIKKTLKEQEILEAYENGEFRSVPNLASEIKKYAGYAENTIKKDKLISIRISKCDLEAIQRKAAEEGLPYQTFISALIRKFISGRLIETEK